MIRKSGVAVAIFSLAVLLSQAASGVERVAVFPGENRGDQYAISICNAGDVNGDGYEDLLVGANLEDTGGEAAGMCYLYFGGMEPDTRPDVVFTGAAGERFGTVVAGGGDLNGDGFCDIAVCAPGAGDEPGKVYVFFGGRAMDAVPDAILTAPSPGGRFGSGLSLQGEVSGKIYDDLVIGFPRTGQPGSVFVYFGSSLFDPSEADLVLRGEEADDYFGWCVSSGGDVDGDGSADLLVGAPRSSETDVWAGKAYLYLCGASMDTVPDVRMTGAAIGDGFGSAVEIAGDLNGDGRDEFIVTAPYSNTSAGNDGGMLYMYLGGAVPDGEPDDSIGGEWMDGQFGYDVSSVDVDGDGTVDLVVGEPGYGASAAQQGRVSLFHGGYPLDPSPLFTDVGAGEYDGLGISVAGLAGFTRHEGGAGGFAAGAWNTGGTGAAFLYGEPVVVTDAGSRPAAGGSGIEITPNPAPSGFRVRFTLAARARVEMALYDAAGREISRLPGAVHEAGLVTRWWDSPGAGRGRLAEGVYFVRVTIGDRRYTCKLVVLR